LTIKVIIFVLFQRFKLH